MKNLYLLLLLILWSCQNKQATTTTTPTKSSTHTNALKNESSPYLLQHAHNPVNWYPWKSEALEKAKQEGKMLIISVGYSSCHWCHVMEKESFEDEAVAKLMNEHFVCIKVDREERPDVDDVYMTACQLSSRGGCGWPLNAFALPDGRPVWAGTYFPKENWTKILIQFIKNYKEDPTKLEQYATELTKGIQQENELVTAASESDFKEKALDDAYWKLTKKMDLEKGGRKGSPKFPMPNVHESLLHFWDKTKLKRAFSSVRSTLDNMANGGIYDQIGGGFARYSTDEDWKVPHFEKMLYDNGQLVSLYAHAYQRTKNSLYKKVIVETLEFVERELTHKNGGFYSSLDADSEGVEGKFYVWKKAEIDAVFRDKKEAAVFCDYYNVVEKGNWEHNNILWVTSTKHEIVKKHVITEIQLEKILEKGKKALMKKRAKRIRPNLDDKILTSWNGLMLRGYVEAYKALGDKAYLKTALKNADFLVNNMLQSDGRLNRNFNPRNRDKKSVINAFLDDYANVTEAFIALYEVTFDEQWLQKAKLLTDYATTHFYNEKSGLYFYTSDLDAALVVRKMELYDNVISASNSVMAKNLFKLGTFLYDKGYKKKAQNMLKTQLKAIEAQPNFLANWLDLYVYQVKPPYEIAIVGDNYEAVRKEIQQHFLPNVFFLGGKTEGNLELLKDKLIEGETRIYVCKNRLCKLPVTDVKAALKQME